MKTARSPTTGLTDTEAEVLGFLRAGMLRKDIAAQRGVTRPAITHICNRLKQLGYVLPAGCAGGQQAPGANERVAPYLGRGMHDRQIAVILGVSAQRVGQVRRRIERQGAVA